MTEHLNPEWHRALLQELCEIPRESATPGERQAAEWLRVKLRAEGVTEPAIEEIRAHSTFWWPLALTSLAGVVSGLRRSRTAAALAASAAYLAAEDLPPGRRLLRRVLPRATATNVIGTLGAADAPRTVVIIAHHDAAHTGVIFDPSLPQWIDARFPSVFRKADTSPPLMWPAILGPALAALPFRPLARFGALMSGIFGAAMVNIGLSPVVPGANDNGTGVVLLIAIARALRGRVPAGLRVILLSTSEEGLCDGMRDFAARHFDELPRDSTFFLAVDTVGSPNLLVLRGEGMTRMREYPPKSLALMDELAGDLGIPMFPNLRLRNATDGVWPLAAGYQCAALCSCTRIKQPSNYHWPTDVPENVVPETLQDAIRLVEALVRRLGERWI